MDGADQVYLVTIFESTSLRSRAGRETVEAPERRARELCHLWGLSHLHGRHPRHPSRLRKMTGQGRGAPPFSLLGLGPLMGASASWTPVAIWCPSLA